MVKVDKDTIESLKAEWDRPLDYLLDEDGDAEPSPKRQRLQQSVQGPSPTTVASVPPTPLETKVVKNDGTVKIDGTLIEKQDPPPKEVTGVDPFIVELCACLSQQIYDAYTKDYFKFSDEQKVKVEIFDTHGDLNPSIPAFAVVRVGNTLIMGWRGTDQIMDFITDMAIAPVHCSELGTAATGVRCQAMMSSFIASDLQVHQDTIISTIEGHNISRIVFTGHSLGGGLGSIAHLFVQAQIGGYNKSSPWATLSHLKLHTITFAAPTSVLDKDEVYENNDHADRLLEDVGASTFNFVFKFDAVPRGYGHTGYISSVLDTVALEAVRRGLPCLPFGLGSGRVARGILRFVFNNIKPLVPIAVQYRHVGKLVYYPEADSKTPLLLIDNGPATATGGKRSKDKNDFNHYSFESYKVPTGEAIDKLLEAHSHFPRSFATYISVPKKKD